jgi:hypothetical protein
MKERKHTYNFAKQFIKFLNFIIPPSITISPDPYAVIVQRLVPPYSYIYIYSFDFCIGSGQMVSVKIL